MSAPDSTRGADAGDPTPQPAKRASRKPRPPKVKVILNDGRGTVRMFSPEKAARLRRDGHARR